MKLKGEITFLINREYTTIRVADKNSDVNILEITLTPDQLSSALSRLSNTECELEVFEGSFDNIGKKHEWETFEFKLPKHLESYDRDKDELYSEAKRLCPKGWKPDSYFGSQNSFFKKGDENWARCTIRRWV